MTTKAIALSALLLFLPICSNAAGNQHAKANDYKVLKFIDVGKTTKQEFLKGFSTNFPKCKKPTKGPNSIYDLGKCFKSLPGSPTVRVDVRGVVHGVFFTYTKGSGTFDEYKASLTQKYGKPSYSKVPFVGDKATIWDAPFGMIWLQEQHMSVEGSLLYMSKDLVGWVVEHEKNLKQKKKNAREELL